MREELLQGGSLGIAMFPTATRPSREEVAHRRFPEIRDHKLGFPCPSNERNDYSPLVVLRILGVTSARERREKSCQVIVELVRDSGNEPT